LLSIVRTRCQRRLYALKRDTSTEPQTTSPKTHCGRSTCISQNLGYLPDYATREMANMSPQAPIDARLTSAAVPPLVSTPKRSLGGSCEPPAPFQPRIVKCSRRYTSLALRLLKGRTHEHSSPIAILSNSVRCLPDATATSRTLLLNLRDTSVAAQNTFLSKSRRICAICRQRRPRLGFDWGARPSSAWTLGKSIFIALFALEARAETLPEHPYKLASISARLEERITRKEIS
jgi:hypothetical protein